MEIKNYYNDSVIYKDSSLYFRNTLGSAVKQGIDLSGADLRKFGLQHLNLKGAKLHSARFDDADLYDSNLSGACLDNAVFENTDLYHADLTDASLRETFIIRSNFSWTNLTGTDFRTSVFSDNGLAHAKIVAGKTRPPETSHCFLGYILWKAAGGDIEKEMIAAWISMKTEWCWPKFAKVEHPLRDWAIEELRTWFDVDLKIKGP